MFSKNELDNAHKAVQLFMGDTVQIGNPVRFIRGYDNYTGGGAGIGNFNNLMRGGANFGLLGNFGHVGIPQNLSSNFPVKNSTWVATSFTLTGGGATRTWIGTAVTLNDVTIVLDVAAFTFTGTIGAYATIAGTYSFSGGIARVISGTISIPTLSTNIFYGKIGWGMTNDNIGATNYQLLVNAYSDLIGNNYSVTINATQTLGTAPLIFDSKEGEVSGMASSIYMAGKQNIFFDGAIFSLKPI